jgi:hypothetical protein
MFKIEQGWMSVQNLRNFGIIGNIHYIYKAQGLLMVVKYALPDVIGFILNKRGPEQAEKDLRDIGKTIAERMLMVWKPKSTNPVEILNEVKKKFFSGKKVRGQVLERFGKAPSKILIHEKDCPVCPEKRGEEVEISQIHYCSAIAGFTETLLNTLASTKQTQYTKASCKTVASVGSGDKECQMLIELKYGGD